MKTLVTLLNDHLDLTRSLQASRYSIRTASYNTRAFLNWLSDTTAVTTPDRLRSAHLEAWQKHLSLKRTRKGLPLKSRSINRMIEDVKNFLKYLAGHGNVPATLPDALSYVKEPYLLPTSVLQHGQVKKLLSKVDTTNAEGYRNKTMLELLYSTGLRAGELLGLNMGDVDFGNATAIVTGKGNKQRVVPIGKTAIKMLESYVRAIRPFLVSNQTEQALFLTRLGKRMPYHTFLRNVHLSTNEAGIEVNVTPHTFRRSCTTELIRGGANLYHVKELLGHESLETLKHYAKLTINDLKKTHEKCHPRERVEE